MNNKHQNRVYVIGTDPEFDPAKDCQLGSVASNYLRNVLYRYNNINSNRRIEYKLDKLKIQAEIIQNKTLTSKRRLVKCGNTAEYYSEYIFLQKLT